MTYNQLSVVVGVRRKVSDDRLIPDSARIPDTVKVGTTDVPTDVVQIGPTIAYQDDGFKYREELPVNCGATVSLDFTPSYARGPETGTIACLVKLADGETYMLSNNHVFGDANEALIGISRAIHPGAVDSDGFPPDILGTLSRFVPMIIGQTTQQAQMAGTNMVDAGLVKVLPGMVSPRHHVFQLDPDPLTFAGVNLLGLPVCKEGRTTGFRNGQIIGIAGRPCPGYGLDQFGNAAAPFAYFEGQLVIAGTDQFGGSILPFGLPGDSGSLVVDQAQNKPVGLLFSGGQHDPDFPGQTGMLIYANPIQAVISALGIVKFLNGSND